MGDIIDRRPGGGGAEGQYVRYVDEGDGSWSESVAPNLRVWNTSTLSWDRWTGSHGKTLQFVAIAQGAAGTTALVSAAGAGVKIKVVSYVFTLSADGTAKFTGTGDLTGAMDVAAKGGVVAVGHAQNHLLETAANAALSIVTTGGAAKGHLAYFVE